MKDETFHSINKASKIFRHNCDTRSCEKKALKRAKKQGFARRFHVLEPLQNRGSRVRILLPLPKPKPNGFGFSLFWCFSVLFCPESVYWLIFRWFLDGHKSIIIPLGTMYDTVSVWYSIKKASRASKEYQNKVWATADFSFLRSPFLWLLRCKFCCLNNSLSLI